jgi:uncharacterized protein
MADKNILDWIALILLIIGGLNWGLVGVGVGDVVEMIGIPILAKIVYILVGVAALYTIYYLYKK